ncbi:MAG: integration host factor subunit alpha [Proteobacteria bacterium]|nr:integration host factor subunit alpha [Pseudomonadota bacterium]
MSAEEDPHTLTKQSIALLIHEQMQCSVKEARDFLEILIEEIKASLEDGDEVKLSGFGKWQVRNKSSRPGRNPHTGENILITERRVVTFYPSTKFKSAVNDKQEM